MSTDSRVPGALTPVAAVRDAIAGGTTSRAGIAQATGLELGTVDLVIEHLRASGELKAETLSACGAGGCGSCPSSSGCVANTGTGRGPVLLTLQRRDSTVRD